MNHLNGCSIFPTILIVVWIITTPSSLSFRIIHHISTKKGSSAAISTGGHNTLRYANDDSATDTTTTTTNKIGKNHQFYYFLTEETMRKERDDLKKKLVVAAIENYDVEAYSRGMTTIAEDLMKKLEPIRPWKRPAHSDKLNARWSFVFTGVPTIGMKLITILSRISVGFPPIDFRDVFLEVSKQQTEVKAIVSVKIFGKPFELHVFTSLRPDPDDSQHGTLLIEQFQGIKLAGFDVPTPKSWRKARTLEISYLDDDMMIARTAGGEPHFLLRHSTCSTDADAETCDIDTELTAYFQEARAKYGEKIARCLVDRAYGEDCEDSSSTLPLVNLMSFKADWLFNNNDGKK